MRFRLVVVAALTALSAAGCAGHSPNIQSGESTRKGPAAPPVRHPLYDPSTPYGQANATWVPPVFDRHGTIVKPYDPATSYRRPDYEHAEWATGAAGGSTKAPPGTF